MGTDGTSIDDSGEPTLPPANATTIETPAPPPYLPAPTPAAPANRSRLGRWVGVAVCVVAAAVAAAAVVAYGQATDDKRAAERELVRAERDLADQTARAEAAEAEAATQQTRADEAEATTEQLTGDLDQRDAELEDYRDGVAAFLALSVELGLGATSSDAECIAEAFVADQGADTLAELTKAFDADASGLDADLVSYADECGVDPESLAPAPPLEPGFAYGDNPTLDALYDACQAGDGAACDNLFLTSQPDSDYERFGLTCGERFEFGDVPESCDGAI